MKSFSKTLSNTHIFIKTLRNLWPYMWPENRTDLKIRVVASIFFLVASKLVLLSVPFFFKWTTDSLNTQLQSSNMLTEFGIGAIALTAAYNLMRLLNVLLAQLRDILFSKVGQNAVRVLACHAFSQIHNLSMRFHIQRKTGALSRTIERGIKGIETTTRVITVYSFPAILECIVSIAFLWYSYGALYFIITCITIVAYVWFTIKASNWRINIFKEMNKRDSEANNKIIDSLINYETVKCFCAEHIEIKNFDSSMSKYEKAAIIIANSLGWLNLGQATIFALGMTVIMLISAHTVQLGQQTVGDFVLINALLIQLTVPLNIMGTIYRDIRQGLFEIEDLFHIINEKPEIIDVKNAPSLIIKKGTISFKDIYFSYDIEKPILKNMSFEIPSGHTVAIVGKSGAGKSTISRLLYRFYEIQDGSISIDGQDIRSVTQKSLRAAIGIIPQDTVLFNNTIAYNILYGRPEASEKEMIHAAKVSQLDAFIESLKEGYNTIVGERGLKLSGGEKQRVAIARAIIKNPPILIFDEATSALDTITEGNIQKALESLSQNRTTLIIAHRLSTIVNVDNIIVLHEGNVLEQGTHAELLSYNGMYASMWTKQQAALQAEIELNRIFSSKKH
ncbi:metal ABC transporter permease [Liberibacter crescens]|nr:metal ABC transporter permease [Liberibacter crescens]